MAALCPFAVLCPFAALAAFARWGLSSRHAVDANGDSANRQACRYVSTDLV